MINTFLNSSLYSINNINNNYIHNNHYNNNNNNFNVYPLKKNILKNEPRTNKPGFTQCNLQRFQNYKNGRSFAHIPSRLIHDNHSIKSSSTCSIELDPNHNNNQNTNISILQNDQYAQIGNLGRNTMMNNHNLSKFKLQRNFNTTNNTLFTNYVNNDPQSLNPNNYKILHNNSSVINNHKQESLRNNNNANQMNQLSMNQPLTVNNNGGGLNLINGNNMLLIPVGNLNVDQNRVNQISLSQSNQPQMNGLSGLNCGNDSHCAPYSQQSQSTIFGYQFLTFGQGFPSIIIKEYRFNSN